VNTLSRRDLLRTGSAAALGPGLGIGRRTSSSAWATATPEAIGSAVDAGPLDELRRLLKGQLLLPGDPGYVAASAPANGRYRNIRPLAVAVCFDESDVVTCVNWCRTFGVLPVGRGGGHSYAGYSATDGLLINISRLNSVVVDWKSGVARVGGAALNRDLLNATADTPFFLPGGTCLGVGVGGLVLGGGIGYNTHWAGLTCDHLTESRIVTADGQTRVVNNDSPASNLFWACRGGAGGSFGINTSFTFQLVPSPQQNVSFYRFDYRGADAAAAVYAVFHDILRNAPAAFNAVAMAQATDPNGGNKRDAIDVFTRGQYIGPIQELIDLVRPLRDLKPTKATLQELPFWDMQRMFASAETESHSFGDISRYAAAPIPNQAIIKIVDLLANCPSRTETANGSIWSLGWIGGDVVNKVPRNATAYVHRKMLTLLRPTPVWPNDAPASVGDDLMKWTNDVIAALAPYTPNESYQNFPNRAIADWQQAYYAENFSTLVGIKAQYDPGNLFRNPQSIPAR
jgi:FAD/FMN-containing dehydrogenase